MTWEHLSEAQLTGYSGRTLDPDELLAVDRHLASCDVCHERLRHIFPGAAKLATNPPFESGEEPGDGPFHLDYVQHLEPYVDGKANEIDREIVESHIALCSKCADDLEDLLEFKQHPVPALAGEAGGSRWSQWWSRFSMPPKPAWVTAVLALAVFTLAAAIIMWTRSGTVQQAEIVLPEPDKQGAAAESVPPSPAPTQHANKDNAPSLATDKLNAQVAPTEEPLIALYDAGGQLILSQSGRLEGLELPPDLRESIERALVTRRFRASPALTGWSKDTNILRSEIEQQNTFAPMDPTGVVIETDRPTFRWRPLEGAQHYVVNIYDAKLRKVSNSDPISGTEWTTPNSLERGVTYSWQISALKDGETVVTPKPPLPQARFRVLDQHAVAALAKLKEFAGRSHLALGVFYWKHGLIEASEREFQALAKANPNSTVVTELLASIRSLLRR